MPPRREASIKQKKWARQWLKHGNALKATKEAYPDIAHTTAQNVSYKNKNSRLVKAYISELLDMAGQTDKQIAQDLRKIIKAGTKNKALKETGTDQALRALDMTARLKDLYPASRKEIKKTSLNVNFNDKSPEEINEMLNQTMTEIKKFQQMTQEVVEIKDEEVLRSDEEVHSDEVTPEELIEIGKI